MQSYVERQAHAQNEWELQEITPSDSVEEDLEQQAWGQIGEEGATDTAVHLPSSPSPSQPLWERQLHHDNWPQNDMNNEHSGIVRSFSSVIARIDFVLCSLIKVKTDPLCPHMMFGFCCYKIQVDQIVHATILLPRN